MGGVGVQLTSALSTIVKNTVLIYGVHLCARETRGNEHYTFFCEQLASIVEQPQMDQFLKVIALFFLFALCVLYCEDNLSAS